MLQESVCHCSLLQYLHWFPSALFYYPFAHVANRSTSRTFKKHAKMSPFLSSIQFSSLVTSTITVSNVSFQRYLRICKDEYRHRFFFPQMITHNVLHMASLPPVLSIGWKSLISVHRDFHFFLQLDSIPLYCAVIYLNSPQLIDVCFQSVLAQMIQQLTILCSYHFTPVSYL